MGSEKSLRLPWRPELFHYVLPLLGRSTCPLNPIILPLVCPVIRVRRKTADRLEKVPHLVGDHDPWRAKSIDQSTKKPLSGLGVASVQVCRAPRHLHQRRARASILCH
jgi:hypothetical protein